MVFNTEHHAVIQSQLHMSLPVPSTSVHVCVIARNDSESTASEVCFTQKVESKEKASVCGFMWKTDFTIHNY